jgi:hypothetical protein
MGLSFIIAAGPRQRIHSWIRVPRDSRPYFTVSDSRIPSWIKVKVTLRLTVSQSVSLGVGPHLGLMIRYLLLFDSYGLVYLGRPLWRDGGSVSCIYCWPRQRSLSRVQVPWDSWPCFTVSDLRLPFSSPPTTRRVTVEVFEPASTRVAVYLAHVLAPSWSRSRNLLPASSWHAHTWHRAPLGPMAIYLFNVKTFVFLFLSLILLIDKEAVGLFLYRLVFSYYTLLHSRLQSVFFFSQGLSRVYIHLIHYWQNVTWQLVLIYTGISVSAGLCCSLCLNLFNPQKRQSDI